MFINYGEFCEDSKNSGESILGGRKLKKICRNILGEKLGLG